LQKLPARDQTRPVGRKRPTASEGPLEGAGFPTSPFPEDWKQISNGELLDRAEARGFACLITNDRNIYAQQNLRGRRLAIIVLPTNLRRHIMERAAVIVDTLRRVQEGQYVVIEPSGLRPVIDYNKPDDDPSAMPAVEPFGTGMKG
jgi:hypothetical protein